MTTTKQLTIGVNTNHPFTVNRLGYGTMRLTGPGIYGEPPRRLEALAILKRAVELGVQFFDTADYYGEDVTNRLLYEALYPYGKELVICTKVGATRLPDKSWIPFNKPDQLRKSIEQNLRTLKQDAVQLVHFRVMPASDTPFEASMEAMYQLQEEGKIIHVGVSNVTPDQLKTALKMGNVASVENMYGHGQRFSLVDAHGNNRGGEEVLPICKEFKIPLVPYFSLLGSMGKEDSRIKQLAERHGFTEAQMQLAWLLHRYPMMLPIPGTSRLEHLEENLKAAGLELTEEEMKFLE